MELFLNSILRSTFLFLSFIPFPYLSLSSPFFFPLPFLPFPTHFLFVPFPFPRSLILFYFIDGRGGGRQLYTPLVIFIPKKKTNANFSYFSFELNRTAGKEMVEAKHILSLQKRLDEFYRDRGFVVWIKNLPKHRTRLIREVFDIQKTQIELSH